jgi:hypothetical protein
MYFTSLFVEIDLLHVNHTCGASFQLHMYIDSEDSTFPYMTPILFLSWCESLEHLQMMKMDVTRGKLMACLVVVPTLSQFLFGGIYVVTMIHSPEGAELKDAPFVSLLWSNLTWSSGSSILDSRYLKMP